MDGLTKSGAEAVAVKPPPSKPKLAERLSFSGKDYVEAVENMDKYFLANRWSDGLPITPATPEAV